jgi:NAD(P)-dependent dehydrogenase (short-subunit alcohol dehydrogenase family)
LSVSGGLTGRTALVTGGGTGIGAGITSALAAEGARVLVAQRTEASAAAARETLHACGLNVPVIWGDLADAEACARIVGHCVTELGGIDILVNNAGVTGSDATRDVLDMEDAQLDTIIDVNLKAPLRCAREAGRAMAAAHSGVIVNVGSVAAYAAQEGATAYGAAKAGLLGVTRGLAFELGRYGIRVVQVDPGDIAVDGTRGPSALDLPLIRRGEPTDVGAVVAFLCTDAAAYVTGTALVVDGGLLTA